MIHLYKSLRVSPHLLDVAVFGTQEASQQLHDIIPEMITLQPVEEMSFLSPAQLNLIESRRFGRLT